MPRRFRLSETVLEREFVYVREALEAAGWSETTSDDWTLWWETDLPDEAQFKTLKPGQWLNHHAGTEALVAKDWSHDHLYEARLRSQRNGQSGYYDFFPHSYSMPDEYDDWRQAMADDPEALWIQKPVGLSRGDGISLIRTPDDVRRESGWMVQRYLQRPHLLDGYKYTLRFFLVITSLDPLRAYVYNNGFTKLCSRPYTLDFDALDDLFVHLTNPAVHKANKDVVFSVRNMDHHRYRGRLREQGIDDTEIFARVHRILTETVIALREPMLAIEHRDCPNPQGCFELYGIDILIDENLKPWLIECNLSPALVATCAPETEAFHTEYKMKRQLIHDLMDLIGATSDEQRPDDEVQRTVFEQDRIGNFTRLWPVPDTESLLPCFIQLRPRDRDVLAAIDPRIALPPPVFYPAPGVARIYPTREEEDGDIVLFSEDEQNLYTLNAVAAVIWLGCEVGDSPGEILKTMQACYPDVATNQIEQDLWDVFIDWLDIGLLTDQGPPQRQSEIDQVTPSIPAAFKDGIIFIFNQSDVDLLAAMDTTPCEEIPPVSSKHCHTVVMLNRNESNAISELTPIETLDCLLNTVDVPQTIYSIEYLLDCFTNKKTCLISCTNDKRCQDLLSGLIDTRNM